MEVENGRIVRVCNCPRSYVWSFAHFFEVLLATLLGGLACEEDDREQQYEDDCKETDKRRVCCRKIDLDCKWLFALLDTNSSATRFAGTEPIYALYMMRNALQGAFNLTRTGTLSARMFRNMSAKEVQVAAQRLGVPALKIGGEGEPPIPKMFHPGEIIQMLGLSTGEYPMMYTEKDGKVATAFSDRRTTGVLELNERRALETRIEALESSLSELKNQIVVGSPRPPSDPEDATPSEPTGGGDPKSGGSPRKRPRS